MTTPIRFECEKILSWTEGVSIEESAIQQLKNTAALPFIFKHIAVMPDVHWGKGSTIGSVIPTLNAIIPAAVGVDIGCGMIALKTSLTASDLPENLFALRCELENRIPHGFSKNGSVGAWKEIPAESVRMWHLCLQYKFSKLVEEYPRLAKTNNINHLGTLGSGNHFVEICIDESQFLWIMLHSGSRGVGNAIGNIFIELAKKDMQYHVANLPDEDLSYFSEGSLHFDQYINAVSWAQEYALLNRRIMMKNALSALAKIITKPFGGTEEAVNCHHNYVQKENHFGNEVWVTRKGAVSARAGELGIIPGSMGTRSYIVRGKGNADSFHSCSHGAGRTMSRGEAKRRFTEADHVKATEGVECRKDAGVIDETPLAYKDIDIVMNAQKDLVEIVHTLKQVVCVKG